MATVPTAPDTSAIEEVIKDLPMVVSESKAGYKTTEFWITIATAVAASTGGIPMPEKYQGFVAAAAAIAYILSRGVAKKGTPVVEPVASV